MLEGGLAPRARAEQHYAGIIGAGRGEGLQGGPQGAKERSKPVNLGIAVQAREDPRDDDPVLQGVAGARRRLGVVSQYRTAAGGVAGEVDGNGEKLLGAGNPDLVAGPEEAAMAEDQLGRQYPAAEQLARAVEIGEHQVEQLGALDHAGLDPSPLVAGQQHGDRVQGPGGRGRGGSVGGCVVAVNVVGDAIVVQQAARFRASVQQLVEAEVAYDPAGVRPVLADPPVGGDHLVVRPRCLAVGSQEIGR